MINLFPHAETRNKCRIIRMLETQKTPHDSYHTPGHKRSGWDITELPYSDNLSCPTGCIRQAEEELADLVGATRSFLLTDGSTSGVLSILYVAKTLGVKRLAAETTAHKSVFNGAKLLGLELLLYPPYEGGRYATSKAEDALRSADALIVTTPNYYGKIPPLSALKNLCEKQGKLLLADGAHGAHLRHTPRLYAGEYAELWVDGVHKSLPSLTQGALVCAKTARSANALREAVDIFRTTSPSYPILASVEYGVRYPANPKLESAVRALAAKYPEYLTVHDDWTKLVARFGANAREADERLQNDGIWSEFCDGERLMFYFSPASEYASVVRLETALKRLFALYPPTPEKAEEAHTPNPIPTNGQKKLVTLDKAIGKIAQRNCGLFPPCVTLIFAGERVTTEHIQKLEQAPNVFGLIDGKMEIIDDTGEDK